MLDIFTWINYIRPSHISRKTSKIYKRWQTNFVFYNLKNINTVYDAVKFIKRLASDGYISCDGIMERICYLYSQYLPTDLDLARLSLLYQSVLGTRGIEEYSTLLIWTSAIQSIMEAESKNPNIVKVEILVDDPSHVSVQISILNH